MLGLDLLASRVTPFVGPMAAAVDSRRVCCLGVGIVKFDSRTASASCSIPRLQSATVAVLQHNFAHRSTQFWSRYESSETTVPLSTLTLECAGSPSFSCRLMSTAEYCDIMALATA